MDTEKYTLRGKQFLRQKETHKNWIDGTAASDIFNKTWRTGNLCFVTSINENLDESETRDN